MKVEPIAQMRGEPKHIATPKDMIDACDDLFDLESTLKSFGGLVEDDFGIQQYSEVLSIIEKASRSQVSKTLYSYLKKLDENEYKDVLGLISKSKKLIEEKAKVFERRPRSFDINLL